jgi:hypothetical protein
MEQRRTGQDKGGSAMRTDRLLDRTPGDRQKLPIGVGAMLALLLVLLLVLRALGLWGGGGMAWPLG